MYARCPFFDFVALHPKQESNDFLFSSASFSAWSAWSQRGGLFFTIFKTKMIRCMSTYFKSSSLPLASCVQRGRCSQRGSSTRAGAWATARGGRPIVRISKTNAPVWRAAQAATVSPSLFHARPRCLLWRGKGKLQGGLGCCTNSGCNGPMRQEKN